MKKRYLAVWAAFALAASPAGATSFNLTANHTVRRRPPRS